MRPRIYKTLGTSKFTAKCPLPPSLVVGTVPLLHGVATAILLGHYAISKESKYHSFTVQIH